MKEEGTHSKTSGDIFMLLHAYVQISRHEGLSLGLFSSIHVKSCGRDAMSQD